MKISEAIRLLDNARKLDGGVDEALIILLSAYQMFGDVVVDLLPPQKKGDKGSAAKKDGSANHAVGPAKADNSTVWPSKLFIDPNNRWSRS